MVPASISSTRDGSSARYTSAETAPWPPLDAEVGRSQGDRRQFDRRTGHRADLDPVHRAAAIGPIGEESQDRPLRRRAPQIVDDDVDLGGCSTQGPCRLVVVLGEPDDVVGTDGGERVEPGAVPTGADHPPGAEPFGHLHGHGPGIAGGAEDEHALARPDRDSSAQCHPRGRGRVQGGRNLCHLDIVGQVDGASPVDHRLVGHRSGCTVVGDEVDLLAVRPLGDGVDTGDHGQLAGAGVVGSCGAGPDPRVQADREHVDEDLSVGALLGNFELPVVRWFGERCHHCRMLPLHRCGSSALDVKWLVPRTKLVGGTY
jgi:hypothetical protein